MSKSASQIGERIRRARERRGLTQKQAGVLLGVHEQTVIRWESGATAEIKSRHLPKIAEFLGVSVAALVGDAGVPGDQASASMHVPRGTSSTLAAPRHARNLPLAAREYLAEFQLRLVKGGATEDEIEDAMRLLKSPDVFSYFAGGKLNEYDESDVLDGMRSMSEAVVRRLKRKGRKL